MHYRPARAEGDLDQCAGGLLSAGSDNVLGFAQARRLSSMAIPYSQCAHARGLGGIAMAPSPTTRSSWGMARSSALGATPGDGAIGCLGDRAKKYSVLPFLSIVDLLVFEAGCREDRQTRTLVAFWLAAVVFCARYP